MKKILFSLLVLCSLSFAEHIVNASALPEIELFIKNEFAETPPLPNNVSSSIIFLPAKTPHTRAGILFFMGRQNVTVEARYEITGEEFGTVKEMIKKDTSWITGYCGMTRCQNKPMSAEERVYAQKFLVSQIIAELKTRYGSAFKEKTVIDTIPPAEADSTQTTAIPDSTAVPDTTAAVPDTTGTI